MLAALASLTASPALAQSFGTAFRYQGRLTDNGSPVNGAADFLIEAYDAATGGRLIGTALVKGVAIDEGLVQFDVDFGSLFLGQAVWLEISFNAGQGNQTLSPRQAVRPTPYALTADFAASADVSLDDAYGNGATINAGSTPVRIARPGGAFFDYAALELGSRTGGGSGRLRIESGLNRTAAELSSSPTNGGAFLLYDENESAHAVISGLSPADGGGGRLYLKRQSGNLLSDVGFEVVGNEGGSRSPKMTLRGEGATNLVTFDLSETGNARVNLGSNAVGPFEILNEPGVASLGSGANVVLTPDGPTLDVITSWSINCPASGYVLVMAQCEASIAHVTGTNSSVNFGVSDSPTSLRASQDIELRVPSSAPTGLYDTPVSVHGVFFVGEGLNTFYFIGDQGSPGYQATAIDYSLTCVYLPTAYGTIQNSREPGGSDEDSPRYGPMTAADIETERAQALASDAARVSAELAAMRARIEELERKMAVDAGDR